MNVISASRRTDIPAFYSEWFMNRIRAGYVRWPNPFGGGNIHTTSLRAEDVGAIVFRSKNFIPLLPYLDELDEGGYNTVFHFTITGLPRVFETSIPDLGSLLECAQTLSDRYGPDRVLWRCDPLLISSVTGGEYYKRRFRELAAGLEGITTRCYFCFAIYYKKVQRNLGRLSREADIECQDPPREEHLELAEALAEIAAEHGIEMLSCCGDYLVVRRIKKAHCIDADLLHNLFPDRVGFLAPHPVREECGCAECVDIGVYDTCPHGCEYCYANSSREVALRRYELHQPDWDMLIGGDEKPKEQGSRRQGSTERRDGGGTIELSF
jgi:hypothetical protein